MKGCNIRRMDTRIINHNDGHIDTEALICGIWVVTKCNLILGEDEITKKLRESKKIVNWIKEVKTMSEA